ncbi:MAG: hypothetical protein E7046_00930 [Lentisphaerae bacterium]|nr:hypothetical protein [Lentisphaerota bacterium]
MSSKLRETMLRCDAIAQLPEIREYIIVKEMRNLIKGALAEPLRNCDVGTVEEQAERYRNFCHNYPKCTGCPCVGRVEYGKCEFAWSQMPYEEVK